MNEEELIAFKAARKPSGAAERLDVAALTCYGCAHSAASMPPPSAPSGERPCCSCVRNPEREKWAAEHAADHEGEARIVIGDDGHARDFDAFTGALYNGAPTVFFPQDNYVTMDMRAQDRFLDEHPEYAKSVRFDRVGNLKVIDG